MDRVIARLLEGKFNGARDATEKFREKAPIRTINGELLLEHLRPMTDFETPGTSYYKKINTVVSFDSPTILNIRKRSLAEEIFLRFARPVEYLELFCPEREHTLMVDSRRAVYQQAKPLIDRNKLHLWPRGGAHRWNLVTMAQEGSAANAKILIEVYFWLTDKYGWGKEQENMDEIHEIDGDLIKASVFLPVIEMDKYSQIKACVVLRLLEIHQIFTGGQLKMHEDVMKKKKDITWVFPNHAGCVSRRI